MPINPAISTGIFGVSSLSRKFRFEYSFSGINSPNLTRTKDFFLSTSNVTHWRLRVLYSSVIVFANVSAIDQWIENIRTSNESLEILGQIVHVFNELNEQSIRNLVGWLESEG